MTATRTVTLYQTSIEMSAARALNTPTVAHPRPLGEGGVRAQVLLDKIAAQQQRLDEQEQAIAFLAGLVRDLQAEVKSFKQLPAPASGSNIQTDQAIEIYRTAANGKLYWHLKTSRYAKHGVALWPDDSTLFALGITRDWLNSLPFDRPTPFQKMVRLAVDKYGKKPKVIGLAQV